MLAIIKTGGKQYIVSPKQKIKVEKLEGKEGQIATGQKNTEFNWRETT